MSGRMPLLHSAAGFSGRRGIGQVYFISLFPMISPRIQSRATLAGSATDRVVMVSSRAPQARYSLTALDSHSTSGFLKSLPSSSLKTGRLDFHWARTYQIRVPMTGIHQGASGGSAAKCGPSDNGRAGYW